METKTEPLPSFTRPPVNEVICGVMFKPIVGMLAPHLGILWAKFRSEYPTCMEVDPLLPMLETFDGGERGGPDLSVPFLPRLWFVSKDDNAIVQVQRDRLLHNWRKVRSTDEYPRYSAVKKQFTQRCSEFEAFLVENQLGKIEPVQFEMTYLNHVIMEGRWQSLSQIGEVFPDFDWRRGDRFFGAPEKINWRTSFVLPEGKGRLHLVIQSALRKQDRLPLYVVELTVRGIGADRTMEGMWAWFDMAREWIVRGFADITGKEIQKDTWGRTE